MSRANGRPAFGSLDTTFDSVYNAWADLAALGAASGYSGTRSRLVEENTRPELFSSLGGGPRRLLPGLRLALLPNDQGYVQPLYSEPALVQF